MGFYFNKEFALWTFEGHFRFRRDRKLKELDVAYQRALENNDEDEKQNVVNQKNFLRNFPDTITTSSFSTEEELHNLWPTGSIATGELEKPTIHEFRHFIPTKFVKR